MYEGLIWMLLPSSLIIINDIFAYIFGKLFGKTQLIALSPNKTVEGFIGGLIGTLIGSFLVKFFMLAMLSFLRKSNVHLPRNRIEYKTIHTIRMLTKTSLYIAHC